MNIKKGQKREGERERIYYAFKKICKATCNNQENIKKKTVFWGVENVNYIVAIHYFKDQEELDTGRGGTESCIETRTDFVKISSSYGFNKFQTAFN